MSIETLYNTLVDQDLLSLNFDEFQNKLQDDNYKSKVHGAIVDKDLYSGDFDTFKNQYLADVPQQEQKEEDTAIERALGKNVVTDFFGDLYRAGEQGMAQGATVDEAFDVYKKGKNISDAELKRYIEVSDALDKTGASDEMREYEKIKNEAGGGVWGFMKGMIETRGQVIPQVIVSSAAAMGRTFFDSEEAAAASGGLALAGGVGGSFVPVVGNVTGAIGGAVAGLTGSMETALTLTELLKEELGDKEFNKENIRAILENEEVFEDIKDRALARGATIGAVEGVTVGLSRGVGAKLLAKGASKGKIARQVTGIEMTGGAGGEALGQVAAGQEFDIAEVLMEGVAEAKGVVNVADILAKKEYKINGEKRTRQEVLDKINNTKPESLAEIQFDITGDKNLDNLVRQKQGDAIFKTQIDERVEETDRNKLVELEKKRLKAEADKKKKGIFAVPGAETTLENIETEIAEIIGRYEGADITDKTVQARKKKAAKVRQVYLEKTKKFLDIAGKQLKLNPYESFETNADYVNHMVEKIMEQGVYKFDGKQINLDNMTQEEINAEAQRVAESVDNSDANIFTDADGNSNVIINEEAAFNYRALNVGSHEILHAVMKKSLLDLSALDAKDNKKKAGSGTRVKTLIADFKLQVEKNLGKNVVDAIEKRLKDGYGMTDEQMSITDEWFNALSDIIEDKDNNITYNNSKGFFDGIKDKVAGFFNESTPYKNLSIATGEDAFNFMKEYSQNVKEGKLSERMLEFAGAVEEELTGGKRISKEGEVDEASKFSKTRGKLVDDINDLQQGATTKAEFQKPSVFNKVFEAIQSGGAINNYIRSLGMSPEKTQETIDAVTDRLINFDPAAKRKDGTVIGPKGLGEFIMANVGFGKLVAAKKLAVKGEKAKKTTTIDTKEAKEVEDTTSTTEVEDKTKARKLKDFDVELQEGLVNDEIVEKVEALLEKNPDDIEVQMEKLILGEIRKMLNNVVPKIAKDKKTGVRKPTPEYEAWVRGQYNEVVQSLGMETIRKAYRPWFESKKIRTEKYKGISPKTGKVTNYVKDVFENSTNKREYIRWFLEGNERNLTERRTALIRRIARRKAKIATDNYIEANSKNLKNIAEAKFRNLSRVIEDTQVEKKSFDKVKFSHSLRQEFSAIERKINKKGNIWAGYINPHTRQPQSFVDLGRVWEQAFANYFMKMEIEGLNVVSEIASEIGGMADFVFEYNGKIENHELKASLTAFMGSISISNFKNGNIEFATDTHNDLLKEIDMAEFTEGYKKRIDFINKGIERLNLKRPNKPYPLLDYDIVSGKPQNIPYELYMDKKGFGTKMFYQLKSDASVIARHYAGKNVNSISFIGAKKHGDLSFRLNDDSILALDMLDADTLINFTFRNSGSKIINGDKMISLNLGVQFKISKLNNDTKNALDITDKSDLNKALGINFSKSINSKKLNNAIKMSRSVNKESKGITILDFDDTLATTKSLVKFTRPDGTTGTLNAEEYASTYEDLLDQGFTFDFSEFNKVVKGKIAPLFQKALKLQGKFGPENMFVLTARPPQAAKAIFDFLKANGLNIPMKNITGLANSTAESKALWVADKVGEGFNDFYFADDALQNTQAVDNVLSQFDVKRKIQQAKVKFSLSTKQNLNWKEDSVGYMTTNFDVDGNNYKITLYPTDLNDTNYELEFDLVTEKGLTQEMTGTGNQFNVLGTVYNGLLDVIKQKPNIETIGFSALTKDKSRTKVYTTLMDKLGRKLGWKTDIYEYGSGTQFDFEVAKPKALKARIKTTESIRNIPAVKNMLNQSDVKSPTQQTKVKFSKSMNKDFNDILENVTGIDSKKRFSAVKARKRGESKGKFRFFIPPSHEDFVGLLYNFIGKGKEGNAHRDFFEKALIRPLNRAYRELNAAKQSIANDYKALNKQFADVKKKLNKKTPDGDFTYQDAIRVYLWDKHGYDIPGLSPTDQQNLVDLVKSDPELRAYAETLNVISKQDKYVAPTESWEAGDIRTDLDDATGRVGRGEFFTEFNENVDVIFSQENLNKIEAAYGADVVSALKDILYRTKTGRNRPSGQNKQTNQWLNYLNGSVAATMFFNIRSAVLQQMSLVNFINYADNNILAAAKAFANQKQYWADWAYIFNSDFMKQRRAGIKTDVNGAELAASVKNATNPAQAAIKKLLELGFLPTQIGDNMAIAIGGSTFYRNRINTYLKQGLNKKEAESKAWTDFQILAESTQQSARPDMVSQQQASPLGKVILAFQNVTSQFNRLGKKAFLDIKNRRITPGNTTQLQSDMSNLSRIAYYFAIQNVIFYSLQSALFMAMFDDDEDDKRMLAKKERVINGTLDSVLRGSGVWGAAISTLKNMAFAYHKEREKDWNGDEASVLVEALNVSPPLGIKARKIVNAERTLNYNRKTIDEMETFDIDNPQWSANTSYIEALTNVPLNRLYNKTTNVRESLDSQHSALERVLMFSGWSKWNLGVEDVEKEKKKQKFGDKKKSKGRGTLKVY